MPESLRDVSDERLEMLVGIVGSYGYLPAVAPLNDPKVQRLKDAVAAVWDEVIRRGDHSIRFEPIESEDE